MAFQQIRVIPRGIYYVFDIVYNKEQNDLGLDKQRTLGIDLGVTNLVTAVNNVGVPPFAIRGGAVKSANQFYNKKFARLRSIAMKVNIMRTTKRIKRLNLTRANKIGDIFHNVSRAVVDFCIRNGIGTIVIGNNPRWKQRCNLGTKNNQNFVGLPLHILVLQVQYKASLVGINTILVNKGYTSRCSFLDGEPVGPHTRYMGRRVRRGLFQSRDGTLLNADVNAAYNILQQAVPEAFADGIEGVGLHPVLVGLA